MKQLSLNIKSPLFVFILIAFMVVLLPASGFSKSKLYINGNILTMDDKNSSAEAVLVEEGLIKAVGIEDRLRKSAGRDSLIVDLKGKTMLPGFIDAHSHFQLVARMKSFMVQAYPPPIGTIKTIPDIISALKKKAKVAPAGKWIVGMGYDDTLLKELRHPTRYDLDSVSEKHPIILMHTSFHLAVVNSMALKIAKIDNKTPNPPGGVIKKNKKTGEPNGVMEESAFFRVLMNLPPNPVKEELKALEKASMEYASQGITTAQDGMTMEHDIKLLEQAVKNKIITTRMIFYPAVPVGIKLVKQKKMSLINSDTDQDFRNRYIQGPIKFIADGSIQGYTGYLKEPYHKPFNGDSSYRGYPAMPREKLAGLVQLLHGAGFQIAIHGNGDAAIDDILFALGNAQKNFPRKDTRHIIIHAQMARDDQLDLMKKLGVVPSFYSLHTYYWGDRHMNIFMGPERASRMSPAASAIKKDIIFTIHTDAPVVPMEPLRLVWAAVNRISTGGNIIGKNERISPIEALRAVTINSAYQHFIDDKLGSIESGKLADFVIIDKNPLEHPETIDKIKVMETIVGGITIYQR